VRSIAVALLLVGCAAKIPPPSWPDAPLALRDESDRQQAVDQLWLLPPGPARDAARAEVAGAIARRIGDAIEEDKPFVAQTLLFELLALWRHDPEQIGAGLADQAPLVRQLRAMFAKSGAVEPAIASLVLLAEIDAPHRTEHLAELDEVLAFTDDLAVAENGSDAVRAEPISQLAATVRVLPLRWLVDRYVTLLVARQQAVTELIDKHGASMEILRPHYEILATSRFIAQALARAGRVEEIHGQLSQMHGIWGIDKELAQRAQAVAVEASADAYRELARVLRSDTKQNPGDPAAAFGVLVAGLAKFPADPQLLAAAAGDAASMGRIDQPIALYEAAIAAGADEDTTVTLKLGRLYSERIARLAFGGRPGAAATAYKSLAHYAGSHEPRRVWAQVAASAEGALGRGLLSQGQLDAAEHALVASLDHAPSADAYETLATLHYKQHRLGLASRYANAGLSMLGASTGDTYHRAKLDRIAGDVMRSAGRQREAMSLYLDSLRAWNELGDDRALARPIAGERKLEAGRVFWYLGGNPEEAIDLVLRGIEVDPDSPQTSASAVAFLIQVGRFTDALDAYHRALGSAAISEFYKVYMSLWIVAEARRRGQPADGFAVDYLGSRHGTLWYEQLAQAATNRLDFAALRAAAQTGPQQAELAFYGAALGLDPEAATAAGAKRLYERVVAAGLVMDAEYDLARMYLGK
jgi:hypothetical protein